MREVILTVSSEKDFKSLTKKNKEIKNLILSKLEKLQDINIPEALKNKEVGIIEGISPKLIKKLKEYKYDPFIYEYRDFSKSHPYRIVFINDNERIFIIWMNHHKETKDKFNQTIYEKINSIIG